VLSRFNFIVDLVNHDTSRQHNHSLPRAYNICLLMDGIYQIQNTIGFISQLIGTALAHYLQFSNFRPLLIAMKASFEEHQASTLSSITLPITMCCIQNIQCRLMLTAKTQILSNIIQATINHCQSRTSLREVKNSCVDVGSTGCRHFMLFHHTIH
jgi:hypothetical protein